MTLKIFQAHVWRPDPKVENRKLNSDVSTRQMTPEEMERYKHLKPKHMDAYGRPVKPPIHKAKQKGRNENERSD